MFDRAVIERLIMFFIGILAGFILWFSCPRTEYSVLKETQVVVREVVKVETKVVTKFRDRTITITEPGKTTVIVEKEQSKEDSASSTTDNSTAVSHKETTAAKSRYSVLAGASVNNKMEVQYTLGADARLGSLPLWVGVNISGPTPVLRVHLRLEF